MIVAIRLERVASSSCGRTGCVPTISYALWGSRNSLESAQLEYEFVGVCANFSHPRRVTVQGFEFWSLVSVECVGR